MYAHIIVLLIRHKHTDTKTHILLSALTHLYESWPPHATNEIVQRENAQKNSGQATKKVGGIAAKSQVVGSQVMESQVEESSVEESQIL